MVLYSKLWEVGSVEGFQQVFLDCVECHYHAYVKVQVLHRNLSENALMFKQDEGDTLKGILNDWDMASHVEANNQIPLSTATHRTGTIPFMAQDLLVHGNPPPHLYRHDLESFFYILVWATFHYDFENKKRLPTHPLIRPWDDDGMDRATDAKYRFIAERRRKNEIFRSVRTANEALVPWMTALWTLFHEGAAALDEQEELPDWDNMTLGGHVTFQKFMQALGREPRC